MNIKTIGLFTSIISITYSGIGFAMDEQQQMEDEQKRGIVASSQALLAAGQDFLASNQAYASAVDRFCANADKLDHQLNRLAQTSAEYTTMLDDLGHSSHETERLVQELKTAVENGSVKIDRSKLDLEALKALITQ